MPLVQQLLSVVMLEWALKVALLLMQALVLA
jgi:hypothetical protein